MLNLPLLGPTIMLHYCIVHEIKIGLNQLVIIHDKLGRV